MVDMTAEHPVNEILAIRRYHEIYTIPYTGTQWHGSTKCRKQAVCVEDLVHWVPLKYLKNLWGVRSHLNGFEILIVILHSLWVY